MFSASVANICQHTFLPLLGPESVVFDLGANKGDFAHGVIKLFGCRVFSAEPVPSLADAIPPHANLHVSPVAISDRIGRIQLNLFGSRCASLLGPARADERSSLQQEVDATTLFKFRGQTRAERISLLKIDIEGAELAVFETASTDLLIAFDQITVEFHDFLYPETRPRVEAIKRKLQMIGFSMVQFSLDNTDVLFINKRLGISWINLCWLRTVIKYARGLRRRVGLDLASARERKDTTIVCGVSVGRNLY